MSRRGGKRRQVLQLGDSSKLHRYGYSKGFQSVDSSAQNNPLTGLVGDYSDSDSDDSFSDHKGGNPCPVKDEQHNNIPPPVMQEPPASVQNDDGEDHMDDELRNFLSEIEAIPMPEENKTPDHVNDGGPSPIPTNQAALPEKAHGETAVEENNVVPAGLGKKKSAYSMFVKGDVEFAHSPSPTPNSTEQTAEDCQEKGKTIDGSETNLDVVDIPEEPKTCWQMVQDENTQYYYYWNWQTNEVTWEIPSDYTQYLLLHKEYEEKIAKIPSKALQAWKDKKAGKSKDTNESSSNDPLVLVDKEKDDKSNATLGDTTMSTTVYPEGREELDGERYSHHHHKKKKSKKHRRRHNSNSDEDLDEKYLHTKEDSTNNKSSIKSKRSKQTMGPQPLSIVPYMSDDNDDDSNNDDSKDDKKGKNEVKLNTPPCSESVAALEVESKKLSSKSSSPASISNSGGLGGIKDTKMDFDSLVQNLVEFHDKTVLPGMHGDCTDIEKSAVGPTYDGKEMDIDGVEIRNEITQNKEGIFLKNMEEKREGETTGVDEIMKEDGLSDRMEISQDLESESSTKDKERLNIFDQFSVIKETKKKKKVINIFAEDSQSEVDDNVVDGENGKGEAGAKSRLTSKPMEEEVEITDDLESLSKNNIEPKLSHHKKEKEVNQDISLKQDIRDTDKQLKSIVGYSAEEEEEGELKEEEITRFAKIKDSEVTSESVDQPKKKVLQYKDYMKKYRSDKSMADSKEVLEKEFQSNAVTPSHSAESVKSHEENSERDEEDAVQPMAKQVDEKCLGEEMGEKKKETNEDDSEDDLDLDDLDNIDRVLEKALEKKMEQKTESKPEIDGKTDDAPEKSHESSSSPKSETKKTEAVETEKVDIVESSVDGSALSDTDLKRLKYAVKDSAELALNKLQFLDISTKNLSKLQVLMIELQTRYSDWQSGGLSTPYFHKQLKSSEALLSQYEESAVPPGWLCQWDRASCRYFYRNEHSGHTQWEYPQVTGGVESSATTTSSKVKSGEVKDSNSSRGRSGKKRRSKDTEEREESSKSRRHNSSNHSSRHRSSKKGSEKDRGKRDRHSSSHHHRKKKRRRRDHSSSSSSSGDESVHSRHRHRSKRKRKGRSDKSPSLEVIDCDGPANVHIIEDSPPPSVLPDDLNKDLKGNDVGNGDVISLQPQSATLGLIADYGSEQDVDDDEEKEAVNGGRIQSRDGSHDKNHLTGMDGYDDSEGELERKKRDMEKELEGIDGVEMEKEEEEMQGEEMTKEEEYQEEEEEEVNSAIIIKPPQIIVPPYVAAMNQPQLYSAPTLYTSAPNSSSTMPAAPVSTEHDHEPGEAQPVPMTSAGQTSEETEKTASKKKKKDKSVKEKSLNANSSIMMKKKRVSSMVQKWQQVKKEVEKENRDKELRQAAIREKINQLKST